jgi:hypothetical protein
MEQLQNMMTRYLYSRHLTSAIGTCGERAEIQWRWNKLKKEMDDTLNYMDKQVTSKIECLSEPKK